MNPVKSLIISSTERFCGIGTPVAASRMSLLLHGHGKFIWKWMTLRKKLGLPSSSDLLISSILCRAHQVPSKSDSEKIARTGKRLSSTITSHRT